LSLASAMPARTSSMLAMTALPVVPVLLVHREI
jgi:hypothetical protein